MREVEEEGQQWRRKEGLQSVMYDWTKGRQEVWGLEEDLSKDAVWIQYVQGIPYQGFGNLKIGGMEICTMKHVDDLVLLIDRLSSFFMEW